MNDLIYKIEKYFSEYFNFKSRAGRKEFNSAIFIYSIIFIALLFLVTDRSGLETTMQENLGSLQYQVYTGEVSQHQAMQEASKKLMPFVPTTFMTWFALLLLPLYFRRLNDITRYAIPFGFPLVIIYGFDAIQALLGTTYTFQLYNVMSLYNFILIALLCIIPSKED